MMVPLRTIQGISTGLIAAFPAQEEYEILVTIQQGKEDQIRVTDQ